MYRPHTYAEVAEMVSSEVAARLEEAECYGIFWINRTRTTRKRESVPGPTGREYRWRYTVRKNPRDQWVAIPVPHSGIPREVVDTARAMIKNNRATGKTSRRFWQIPSGAVCCEGCGTRTLHYEERTQDRHEPPLRGHEVPPEERAHRDDGARHHEHRGERRHDRPRRCLPRA